MKFTETGSCTYNGENKTYSYATDMSIAEQIAFVEAVSDSVFVGGNYLPLLTDPVFRYTLITTFTDIDIKTLNIDDFDVFDKATGVSEMLKDEIRPNVYNNLKTSIDSNIEYKKTIAHDNISTAIVELINVAKDKLEAFGEGLDANAVMDFVQKFSESGIDAESIVNTYLNSEQYKENVSDVVDAKNAEIRDLRQKLNKETAKNVMADKSYNKVIPIKSE